jgi:erythromycin esterase-like protein
MAIREAEALSEVIRRAAVPLTGAAKDYDALLDLIGDARLVLLGEASHGTHEFYHERAQITKRLIREKGFTAVAVEADWPDAYRVNQYVRGEGEDATGLDALASFKRFPTWMWRNADVLDFVGWLRAHNDERPREARAGFYGLDLYSLSSSIEAVLGYLDKVDPEAAKRARYRYGCFEDFGENPQAYGYAASFDLGASCEDQVVRQLVDLQRQGDAYMRRDGHVAADALFYAEQNARLVKNAEAYYRAMFQGQVESWNLRDRHMAETAGALLAHLDQHGGRSKLVLWAHNSHLGDARHTEMGHRGELNVGQLLRERYGREAVRVGCTTHTGTVTAASDWDEPAERKRVRPSMSESYERVLHEAGLPRFMLGLRDAGELKEQLGLPRLERAIGVIYRPDTERASHYFYAELSEQFDAVLHFDTTRAVEPLDSNSEWVAEEPAEMPETYPSGL